MLDLYTLMYKEGNSPQNKATEQMGDMLEEMKDALTESLGEEYYEKVVRSTTGSGGATGGSKIGGGGSVVNHPKVTNFNFDALRNGTNAFVVEGDNNNNEKDED